MTAKEAYEELKKLYRIRRSYKEQIELEMKSDFNKTLNQETA